MTQDNIRARVVELVTDRRGASRRQDDADLVFVVRGVLIMLAVVVCVAALVVVGAHA